MKRCTGKIFWLAVALLTACEGGGKSRRGTDAGADGATIGDGAADRARPINLGAGYNAGVAIDQVGSSYIAWVGPESTVSSLNFCRLPRGAVTCDVLGTIAADGTSLSRPFVTVNDTTVKVLSYRYGLTTGGFSAVLLFTSVDGGRTFGVGRQVGTTPFESAVLGPGDSISLATHAYSNGLAYQAVPLGKAAAASTEAILSTTHPYSGAVGLLDGSTPVVVFANGGGDAQMRRYLGTGDPNAEASWSPAQDIGRGDRMHLAGGVKGLFLLGEDPNAPRLQVRRYEADTFGAAVFLPNGTGELAQAHMIEDATGRLHVVWPRIDAVGFQLYYATSDDGAAWQQGVVTTDEGFDGVRVALTPDRIGVAVWATGHGSGSTIHAIALGPTP